MQIISFPTGAPDARSERMSFEDFYNTYYSMALFYAMKKISHADAEDLVSEVFVYCYEHFGEYDPAKSSYKTWLFIVLNSRLKNFYRDRRITADWSELENVLGQSEDDMCRAVYLEQLRDQLVAAVKQLPERQMKAVVWRYFQEKSFEEIADLLDTTPGNVRVMLTRAMDKLKKSGNLSRDL